MNYSYNKHFNLDAAHKSAILMLKSFFSPKNALISTPTFSINQTSVPLVTVQLFYYLAPHTRGISDSTLKSLISALTGMYSTAAGQPINVQLELVRQYHPYLDANILAQYLAINASKYGFNRMMNYLLSVVPYINPSNIGSGADKSYTTGVKVQLSGLLTSQRNSARKSTNIASAGTFHTSDIGKIQGVSTVIDYGSHTTKSQLGSFTVKVWISSTSVSPSIIE